MDSSHLETTKQFSEESTSSSRESNDEGIELETGEVLPPTRQRRDTELRWSKFTPPRHPICFEFQNISWQVHSKVGKPWASKLVKKAVLSEVSGRADPGELVVIVGPSGSGKTTLLNIIAGRVKKNVTGKLLVNGQPMDRLAKRHTAFVLQDDIFFSDLTVKQTLELTAQLVLPDALSTREKMATVSHPCFLFLLFLFCVQLLRSNA